MIILCGLWHWVGVCCGLLYGYLRLELWFCFLCFYVTNIGLHLPLMLGCEIRFRNKGCVFFVFGLLD